MPKKQKGGNQQKAKGRKSQQKTYSPQTSRSRDAPGVHPFSMRDEVLSTERHNTTWSPSSKLRNNAVRFVSAGTMAPIDTEPDVEAVNGGNQEQNVPGSAERDHLDSDLERSDGALATMQLGSSGEMELSDEDIRVQEEADQIAVDTQMPSALDGVSEQEHFMIDTTGDVLLRPNSLPHPFPEAFAPRASSPVPSASSDEVIIFRGRGDHVTIQEDPLPHPSAPLRSQDEATDGNSHITDALMAALDPPRASHAPETRIEEPQAMGWGNKPPRTRIGIAKTWVHADGTTNIAPDFPTVNEQEAAGDDNASRRSKKARKRQNRQMRRIYQELDDDMVQDYLDNISDPENLTAPKRTLGGTDDEWESSVMSEEQDLIKDAEAQLDDQMGPILDNDDSSEPSPLSSEADSEGSEDGDDSELESDLEYNEREMWEDEDDLRQRQRDAMTDEEIARILAKQESMGIGGDEIFLYDDSGFGDLDDARAGLANFSSIGGRNRNGMRRSRGPRRNDHFPDASLMADVLEQDPDGGFDLMDWERPSLRKKSKGRKSAGALPEELLDLSDEELKSDLQSSWAADRRKKAAKKAEREELRAQGLLGSGRRNGKADLSQRYLWGMDMKQMRDELREFLVESPHDSKAFPPMAKSERKVLHEIAQRFNLTSNSRGSGKNRFTVFAKTSRTLEWSEQKWSSIMNWAERGFLPTATAKKGKKKGAEKRAGRGGGFDKNAVGYRHGEVVGGTAPEIAQSNFGRKLMEKMGWAQGMALGKEDETGGAVPGRLLVPVQAKIKSGRGGLG